RSLCEVALRWPGDPQAAAESFTEALSISKQMEATVTTLLALVRSHSGTGAAHVEPVDLSAVLMPLISSVERTASERGVTVEKDAIDDCPLMTDRTMLSIILRNLLTNAV